ncbi:MAG: glycine cleavage system protein GcvH [Dehalococcoidia bacterium]|nr:glycine cleavage system protein GcvH [Dehalococcoidia bacterium]
MAKVPSELRYSKEHEWVKLEGATAVMGITDYAQAELGDVVYLNLPPKGTALVQSHKMGEIESVKAVSDLFAPVSGVVAEVNQAAIDSPELVNKDPFGGGWLVKATGIEPGELANLLTAAAYESFLEGLATSGH